MFEKLSADRVINIIEYLVADEHVRDAASDKNITRIRDNIAKMYIKSEKDDEVEEYVETAQTGSGYVGLMPPVG